jgi:hypothetical protein
MHPGYWILRQIALTCPTASLFVRARVPSRSRVLFRHIDSLENVADQWDRWLFPALNEYSERGSMIEYAINPRAEGPRNPEVVGTAVCVGLLPGKHFTLERRLRQIAMLRAMHFAPSYVIQTTRSCYAVYQFDSVVDEARRMGIARKLAYLTDTALEKRASDPYLMLPLPGFIAGRDAVKLIYPEPHGSCEIRTPSEFSHFPDVSGKKLEKYEELLAQGGEGDDARSFLEGILREASEVGDARSTLVQIVSAARRRSQKRIRKTLGAPFREPDQLVVPDIRALPLIYLQLAITYMKKGIEMSISEMAKLVYRYSGRRLNDDVDMPTGMQGIDRAIIAQLIELGYVEGAVLDFYRRPEFRAGIGKPDEYLRELYSYELEKLRAADAVPRQVAEPTQRAAWEFIVAVCSRLETTELGKYAKVRGDVLDLDVLACHPLYEKQLIEEGKSPLTRSHIQLAFRNCHDPYWLGSEDVDDRKMWRFSVSRLREQGLPLVFASLTAAKN